MSKKLLPPIHLACSDDEIRHALMYVEVLDGIATATNGVVIVRMNLAEHSALDEVTIKKLSGKYIHADIWALLANADNIFFNSDEDQYTISYIKGGIEADIVIKSAQEVEFPKYDSIIRKIANAKYEKKSFISFNPDWIKIASKIFSCNPLIIRFYEQEQMFTLFPSGDAKAFMGIMPYMLEDKDAVFDFSLT